MQYGFQWKIVFNALSLSSQYDFKNNTNVHTMLEITYTTVFNNKQPISKSLYT